MKRHQIALVLMLIVDVGLVAWGAMAAALPDFLLGPGGKPILRAGYEGFTGSSWSELVRSAPMTAGYIGILFRMYGMPMHTVDQLHAMANKNRTQFNEVLSLASLSGISGQVLDVLTIGVVTETTIQPGTHMAASAIRVSDCRSSKGQTSSRRNLARCSTTN